MADDVKPTDGSSKQWDKLQSMRRKSGTALTTEDGKPADAADKEREQRASAEAIKAEQEKLQAGAAVGGKDEEAPPDDDEGGDDEDEAAEETVHVEAHDRAKPKPKEKPAEDEKPPDGCEFVEIDGKKVAVDKSLAEAYRASETAKVEATKTSERTALADEVVQRVLAQLPKGDTPTDKAIKDAVAAVDAEPLKHPMPDGKLAVSDPDEFAKQIEAHNKEQAERITKKILAERDAKAAAESAEQRAAQAKQTIVQAKEQLSIQFFRQFKVLDDEDLRPIVEPLLHKKIDEVIASGAVDKPLPPKEGEALKIKVFNEVAAVATRQIVKLRGKATSADAPPPTPPNLVTSKPAGSKKKVETPAPKPKEKYPTGSVSAALAAHKSAKEGRSKPAA